MKSVFLVLHLHMLDECEDVKTIGIYRTREAALSAVERLKTQPGFEDHPQVRNPLVDEDSEEGFYIDEFKLDEDHWTEGFITI